MMPLMDRFDFLGLGKSILFPFFVLGTYGCAPAAPDLSENSQRNSSVQPNLTGNEETSEFSSNKIHHEFKMRIRTSSHASLEEKREADRHIEFRKNQIFYKKPIRISSSINYFLVWAKQSKTDEIVQAHFSYSVLNGDQHWHQQIVSRPIAYDLTHKRWYIPISEIVKTASIYKNHLYKESELQVLTLYLLLKNQNLEPIEVRFRITGECLDQRMFIFQKAIKMPLLS